MNKKIIAKKGKLTTPLLCIFVAGNLVGCEVDKEEPTFDADSFKVSTNVDEGGTASIASTLVSEGESVTITVTPDDGYELESIEGCEGQLVDDIYTTSAITGSCVINVAYMLERVPVSIRATAGGSADVLSQLINPGSKAIFNLTANEGFHIGEVTGCEGSLEGSIYTTSAVNTSCEVSATFIGKTFEVTTDVSAGGSVDPASQTITYGNAATITLIPDSNFGVGIITGCDGSLAGNVYTTATLTEPCKITVDFAEEGVLLTSVVLASTNNEINDVETLQYSATANFSNGKTEDVADIASWTTSDSSIAIVDETGLVTALKAGTVTVSASYTHITGTSVGDLSLTITPSLQIVGDRGGSAFAARKTDGSVVTWGDVTRGGDTATIAEQLTHVNKVITNRYAFAAIKNDGSVVTWGDPAAGSDSSAVQAELNNVVEIVSNREAFAALKSDGTVVTWGVASAGVGEDSSGVQEQLTDVISITANIYAFAALKRDGTVVTWGYDGRGATSDSAILDTLVGVTKIVSNYRSFSALKDDDTVVSWGYDSYITGYNVDKLVNIKDITSNLYAYSAQKSDGSIVTWGYKARGEVSDEVAALLVDVTSVASNAYAFAAIKSDDTLVTWGEALNGGDSSAVSASLTNVASVTGTLKAFAAVQKDGKVVTWGDVGYGGDSSAVTADLVNVVSVSATYQAFAALRSDGTVVSWGLTGYGADSSAVQPLLTGVKALVSNRYAFSAIKEDGTVVTWGDATKGGDSSTVSFD